VIRKLLCLSALVSSLANAGGVIAEGKTPHSTIALTDKPCVNMPYTKVAYTYNDRGQTLLGCWASDESRVFVAWNDLRLTSYAFNFFNVKGIK
jgi:hypothetical protein